MVCVDAQNWDKLVALRDELIESVRSEREAHKKEKEYWVRERDRLEERINALQLKYKRLFFVAHEVVEMLEETELSVRLYAELVEVLKLAEED